MMEARIAAAGVHAALEALAAMIEPRAHAGGRNNRS